MCNADPNPLLRAWSDIHFYILASNVLSKNANLKVWCLSHPIKDYHQIWAGKSLWLLVRGYLVESGLNSATYSSFLYYSRKDQWDFCGPKIIKQRQYEWKGQWEQLTMGQGSEITGQDQCYRCCGAGQYNVLVNGHRSVIFTSIYCTIIVTDLNQSKQALYQLWIILCSKLIVFKTV